ncbi:hypothetical protein D6783_02325 [Candidatus Woesearchaeota archaeon]|nr:MAG: hypothetical protein D6783_02325 [Candidatus Woesearchaeota archaeon]
MVKLKPLLPVLKEKKRYLVFRGSRGTSKQELLRGLFSWLGVRGFAKAGVQVVVFNERSCSGIIRCSAQHVDEVRIALCSHPLAGPLRVVAVSGILKKAKEALSLSGALNRSVSKANA